MPFDFGAASGAFGFGLVSSAANKAMDYEVARKLQHDQQDFTKEQWLNKHQWEVSDLRKAGLNPILSAKYGGSPTGTGIASTGAADIAGNAQKIAQFKLIDSQADQAKTASEANTAQKAKLLAEARKTDAEAKLAEVRADNANEIIHLETLPNSPTKLMTQPWNLFMRNMEQVRDPVNAKIVNGLEKKFEEHQLRQEKKAAANRLRSVWKGNKQ